MAQSQTAQTTDAQTQFDPAPLPRVRRAMDEQSGQTAEEMVYEHLPYNGVRVHGDAVSVDPDTVEQFGWRINNIIHGAVYLLPEK